MGNSHHQDSIKNPGKLINFQSTQMIFIILAVIGIGISVFGFIKQPERTWVSFLHSHFYFMALGLGGAFIAAIQWLTGAMWSAPVRRVAEAFTSYLPFILISFALIAFFGMHSIFEWTHPEHVKGDIILEHKAGYLNTTFFTIRNFIAIIVWIFFARKLVFNSNQQDQDGSYVWTAKNKVLSPLFISLFAITFTMAAFDQLMSLDPHWFSTMFGVYCFAGLFTSSLALMAIVSIRLRQKGYLEGILNENHYHDMGKFMFAFTVFWAYIGFSQFMLIWYANLPEETGYFLRRFEGQWLYVSIALFIAKFLIPFFALLPREAKRSGKRLTFVGIWMLIASWIDLLWIIQPEFHKDGPVIGLIELGTFVGFAGIFGLCVIRFLSRHNVAAFKDPKFIESVLHHHQ